MDRGMATSLSTEKLDRTNYASWSYKMHQYLLGHGYWSYVEGANDAAPKSIHRDFPAWECYPVRDVRRVQCDERGLNVIMMLLCICRGHKYNCESIHM